MGVGIGAAINLDGLGAETLFMAERCEVSLKCRQSMFFCLVGIGDRLVSM
jgi:hypothetical protein